MSTSSVHRHEHITPHLIKLKLLPATRRIEYKLPVHAYRCLCWGEDRLLLFIPLLVSVSIFLDAILHSPTSRTIAHGNRALLPHVCPCLELFLQHSGILVQFPCIPGLTQEPHVVTKVPKVGNFSFDIYETVTPRSAILSNHSPCKMRYINWLNK